MRKLIPALAGIFVLWGLSPAAQAVDLWVYTHSSGTVIEYGMVLPSGFDRDKAYPAIIVFPGGRQSLRGAVGSLERFWEVEAVKRGYIAISPGAPAGMPFFENGADLVPEFLQYFLDNYNIEGGKFIIAGHSNGGVSSFHVAVRYPELFHSLVATAGFPELEEDFAQLERIKHLKITMFVGDGDTYWKDGMQRTSDRLRELGNDHHFQIIPLNGHFLPAITEGNTWKIFDRMER